jgi:hypothetical protein
MMGNRVRRERCEKQRPIAQIAMRRMNGKANQYRAQEPSSDSGPGWGGSIHLITINLRRLNHQ